jgi:hypothetical protein
MRGRRNWFWLAAAAWVVAAAGCGEGTSVTVYKQGQYQGKPDQRPWDNDIFKGDRAAWEKAIRTRTTAGQDEYARAIPN